MTYDRERKARVLLMEVEARVSERTGRPWYAAWLGKARVIGFEADQPNERGHKVIRLFVEEPKPRDGPPRPPAKAPERASGSGRGNERRAAGAPSGGPGRPSRRESQAARRERVSARSPAAMGSRPTRTARCRSDGAGQARDAARPREAPLVPMQRSQPAAHAHLVGLADIKS
jgi:hypothetical protein